MSNSTQKCLAKAVFDNVAESIDELAFCKNDILVVLEQNTAGLEGWWLCSLKGRQGICPGNRLRLLPGVFHNQEQSELSDKRRSWHGQQNKVITPRKFNDIYLFEDHTSHENYDVPPSPKAVIEESSQVDYDTPKPFEISRDDNNELNLGQNEALLVLDNLKSNVLLAIVRLLKLSENHDFKGLLKQLEIVQNKLHEFINFTKGTLVNSRKASDLNLSVKLEPRILALIKTECSLRTFVDANDHLDMILETVRILNEDVKEVTSFLHGNCALLFKKEDNWLDDYDYIHLALNSRIDLNDDEQSNEELNDDEIQVLICFASKIGPYCRKLTQEIDSFLQTIEHNRPPKDFVACGKRLLLSVQWIIILADAISRDLRNACIKKTLNAATDRLSSALETFYRKMQLAVDNFPTVNAVQSMVDTVVDVSHLSLNLKLVIYKIVKNVSK